MRIEQAGLRWIVVALTFAAATLINMPLQPLLEGRAPLLPYFPALVFVGLTCGMRPALALLAAACLAVLYFWIAPFGQFWPIDSGSDLVLIALFGAAGAVVAAVAAWAGSLMTRESVHLRCLNLALTAGRMVSWDWNLAAGSGTVSGNVKDVIGTHWTRLEDMLASVDPADAPAVRLAVDTACRSGGVLEFVCRMHKPGRDSLIWTRSDGVVELDAKGRAARAVGVTVDITAQHLALLASRAAEQRFQLALESAKVTAWECDRQGRLVWTANAPGGESSTALSAPAGAQGGGPGPSAFAMAVARALQTGEAQTFETTHTQDERTGHFLNAVKPVSDAPGEVHRLMGATVDITELTVAHEMLRADAARKDVFLATLAHELRNPMAPIRYAVEILRKDVTTEQRDRAISTIARQSAHMARLLEDLLDLSRITRNVVTLQRSVIDLRAVAAQALEASAPHLRDREQSATLSTPATPVLVNGDPTRLQQVLGNLLDNAAKYSAGPGTVRVEVSALPGQARVTVADSGIGIAAEDQAGVFEMFTRLSSGSRAAPGLGIGLAVTRHLIELHGGRIDVSSAGANQGSTFTLELPLVEGARPARPARLASEDQPLLGELVLVVDDNRDAADALAEVLQYEGFRTAVAYAGQEALALVRQQRPRAVLLDIGLPDMSGLDVCRQLRAEFPGEPLILLAITGWGQQADRDQTGAAGFDAHLTKPVDYADLDAALRQASLKYRIGTRDAK